MVATLQSRKEALEAKIQEKNEELKRLCLQEADLTGVIPPEIPLEPGEPPPQIRRRVGTSFSFPQSLINNIKGAGDETLTALELECKVQTNIAEAALSLANDTSANKAARRKHRLMYRQSQRRLMELETRLTLLRQGKSQQIKPLQIKKKPRPNTTAVDIGYMWNTHDGRMGTYGGSIMWPPHGAAHPSCSTDEVDTGQDFMHLQGDLFGSSLRSLKSSGTSQSSSSPRIDIDYEHQKPSTSQAYSAANHLVLQPSLSHPNIQNVNVKMSPTVGYVKRSPKRNVVRQQWDTQSAGGTLLPNQTYPDHSHQPNLSRTQSLGSMEANTQRHGKDSWSVQDFTSEAKEKEWYETSLDSAPSPPIRTSSRLPPAARLMYQMQDVKMRGAGKWAGPGHPALVRTHHGASQGSVDRESLNGDDPPADSPADPLGPAMQRLYLNSSPRVRSASLYSEEALGGHDRASYAPYHMPKDFRYYQTEPPRAAEVITDSEHHARTKAKLYQMSAKQKYSLLPKETVDAPSKKPATPDSNHSFLHNDSVYINIPEDNLVSSQSVRGWMNDRLLEQGFLDENGEVARASAAVADPQRPPTQPYYHATRATPQPLDRGQVTPVAVESEPVLPPNAQHHPPHAITQNEITFDTIVPFESPQNHTVVQAGKWQPYREVTKPFEMSDFYKYSTKFRQLKPSAGSRALTPDNARSSPSAQMSQHQKGIYQPLKPMTCQPVESKSQVAGHYDEADKHGLQVSPPEIV